MTYTLILLQGDLQMDNIIVIINNGSYYNLQRQTNREKAISWNGD